MSESHLRHQIPNADKALGIFFYLLFLLENATIFSSSVFVFI